MATKTNHGFKVGDNVFIRTVTMYYTGKVVAVSGAEVALSSAAWIADCGRFAQFLSTGKASEVEPYPDGTVVRVSRGAIADWCDWPHPLPRATK
jgi:hypothetical protein